MTLGGYYGLGTEGCRNSSSCHHCDTVKGCVIHIPDDRMSSCLLWAQALVSPPPPHLLIHYNTDRERVWILTNQTKQTDKTSPLSNLSRKHTCLHCTLTFLAPPAERQRRFSNADLSVVRLSVRQDWGGRGLSQKRFSNFSSFLAWSFFGVT